MVFVHEAACEISDRTLGHYQRKQARVRRSAVGNLGCQISDCYLTEEGRWGYEATMQYDCQEGQKSTLAYRCCIRCNMSVSLFVCCTVIDERKNKTNTSKLHTNNYNVGLYHSFVNDIFQTTAIHVLAAFGRVTCINRMLTVVCRPMSLFYER